MNTLTVALPLDRPTLGTEFSYVLSADGKTVLGHGIAPLTLLPRADATVLVVPARCLSWHDAKLPPLSAGRLRAALDGLLEDRLLDEPANLALALGPQRSADGTALVAACDKLWLRAALQFFESGQRPASRVVPEFEPALEPAQCRLVATGTAEDAWLARVGLRNVLSSPLHGASALLDAGAAELETLPLSAEPAVAGLAEQALARPAFILETAQALLASNRSAWELAQFDLALSSGGRMARRWAQGWQQFARAPYWRPARWGLIILLLANFIGLNAWAWRQDSALQAKRDQVKSLLTQTFPRVRTIVDPPLQMERELALLRQAGGGLAARDLEVMLAAVGAALPPGKSAAAIDFSPGEAVLKGVGLSESQMALFSGKLAGQSYSARLDGERLLVRAGNGP